MGAVVDFPAARIVRRPLGGCPTCGGLDGFADLHGGSLPGRRWAFCRQHRIRWIGARLVPGAPVPSQGMKPTPFAAVREFSIASPGSGPGGGEAA
ncbi:MAG: hypothetical protein RLO50_14465 [Azospirillaceae bacterium]